MVAIMAALLRQDGVKAAGVVPLQAAGAMATAMVHLLRAPTPTAHHLRVAMPMAHHLRAAGVGLRIKMAHHSRLDPKASSSQVAACRHQTQGDPPKQ